MKSKNKARLLILTFFILVVVVVASNVSTTPSYEDSCDDSGCHDDDASGYTIESDVSEIEAEESEVVTLEISGTGVGLIINVYEGAADNDLFTISPSNKITDNSGDDTDDTVDAITVELEVEVPEETGEYTLRILSMDPSLDAGATLDITITVGSPTPSIYDIILDHNAYYLGGLVLIFMLTGLVVFQVNVNREKQTKRIVNDKVLSEGIMKIISDINLDKESEAEENIEDIKKSSNKENYLDMIENEIGLRTKKVEYKAHGFFLGMAFLIASINIFLVLNSSIDLSLGTAEAFDINNLMVLSNLWLIGQLTHMILGIIGYIAAIIAIVGTIHNMPGRKLKLPIYIMAIAWTFNFIYGFYILSPSVAGAV